MSTTSKRYDIFKGSYIYILTRTLRSTVGKHTAPIIVEGFLLEEDEDCYYLGQTPDEVTDSITKTDVVRMYLPIDELNAVLEQMNPNGKDMN